MHLSFALLKQYCASASGANKVMKRWNVTHERTDIGKCVQTDTYESWCWHWKKVISTLSGYSCCWIHFLTGIWNEKNKIWRHKTLMSRIITKSLASMSIFFFPLKMHNNLNFRFSEHLWNMSLKISLTDSPKNSSTLLTSIHGVWHKS